MSASREKKLRKEAGAAKKVSAKIQQKHKETRKKAIIATLVAVLACAVLVLVVLGSGILPANLTVLTIDGVDIKAAEFNYHFFNTAMRTQQEFAQFEIFIDLDSDLRRQPSEISEGSWADHFEEQTIQLLETIVAQSEAARAQGITLTDEDITGIDETIGIIEERADHEDVSVNRVLRDIFGRGININSFRATLEREALSRRYAQETLATFDRSEEAINLFYEENQDDFDFIDYHIWRFPATPPATEDGEELTEEELEDFINEQRAVAASMLLQVTTGDEFLALSREFGNVIIEEDFADEDYFGDENYEEDAEDLFAEDEGEEAVADVYGEENEGEIADEDLADDEAPDANGENGDVPADDEESEEPEESAENEYGDDEGAYAENYEDYENSEELEIDFEFPEEDNTLIEGIRASTIEGEELSGWLTDLAREEGDSELIEEEGSFAVVLFLQRWRNEEAGNNVRHILASFDQHETSEAAREHAEELLRRFLSGDADEDYFAALADEYTDDHGSRGDGGLYENITSDTPFVEPFLNWTLDPARRHGDTEIVETDHGFHIMFFQGQSDEEVWAGEVREAMDAEEYNAHLEELLEDLEVNRRGFGMLFAMRR